MPAIRTLAQLSALTTAANPTDAAVEQALPLLRDGLQATDVFLVYGSGEVFRHFGTRTDLKLDDVALWLIHRDLVSRGKANAFNVRDGRVEAFRSMRSREPCDHVADLIPMMDSNSEILIARGSWPAGLGSSRTHFLTAALPCIALLLGRRLDSSRAERQRNLLSALANISGIMSDSEDLDGVLTSIARTIATVTGINYISIDIVDADGTVRLRCVNTGERTKELTDRWRRGASKPDPIRDIVLSTRRPVLFRDAQNDERIPESGRSFFVRTLIRSTATFPLGTKDEMLGLLSVASHRPLDFPDSEVELLEGFATQVASAIKGIRLYQELAESREELRHLNRQLQERMGIQHHLARTDSLTGIPNRRFIDETLESECARARRYQQDLSAVVADLDGLKMINDTHGHQAGDDVLRHVAELARESCRQVDVVGRYGGDEFVFVLPATGLSEATAFAERFRRHLAERPAPLRTASALDVTASLGVSQSDWTSTRDPARVIRQADRAMYEAKAAGRNRTMVATGDSARAA